MSTLNQSTNKRQLWFIFVRKKDELANTCLQANNNSRVSLQVCVCGDEGGGEAANAIGDALLYKPQGVFAAWSVCAFWRSFCHP